jgi:hypothetical protein
VNQKQLQEIEKQLGRPLTSEEIRLLQYTEKKPLELIKKKPARRKKAARAGE